MKGYRPEGMAGRWLASRSVAGLLLVLWACGLGRAQVLVGQWVGSRMMAMESAFSNRILLVDESDRVQAAIPGRYDHLELVPPVLPHLPIYRAEAFWQTCPQVQGQGADRVRTRVLLTHDGSASGRWERVGSFELPRHVGVAWLLPLDGDRVLCLSDVDLRSEGVSASERTWAARLKLDSRGTYRFEDAITLPQGDYARLQGRQTGLSRRVTPDRYTVLDLESGRFWIFSQETGRLTRSGRLEEGLTEAQERQGKGKGFIRTAMAEADGRLLIQARPLERLLTAERPKDPLQTAQELTDRQPELDSAAHARITAEARRLALAQEPFLVWYRLDPLTGRARRIQPPEGAAEVVDPDTGLTWRPLPDGKVRMGRLRLRGMPQDKGSGLLETPARR